MLVKVFILNDFYSWTIINQKKVAKRLDKSAFLHKGTGIPIELRKYFGVENIQVQDKIQVRLIVDGITYDAIIEMPKNQRTRLIWSQQFANLLLSRFPLPYEQAVNDETIDPLYMTFSKDYEDSKNYTISFDETLNSDHPNVWWVNQGATLNSEVEHGILWAPLKTSNGRTQYHWETMAELKTGDIVLHYANGALHYISEVLTPAFIAPKPGYLGEQWDREGRLAKVQYYKLHPSIELNKFNDRILKLNIDRGPLTVNGSVKQGYLFYFSQEGLEIVMEAQPETVWPEFIQKAFLQEGENLMPPEMSRDKNVNEFEIQGTNLSVDEVVDHIINYIAAQGFTFEEDLIKNFYLSLKTKPFVI